MGDPRQRKYAAQERRAREGIGNPKPLADEIKKARRSKAKKKPVKRKSRKRRKS